jgi:hypothetical protein
MTTMSLCSTCTAHICMLTRVALTASALVIWQHETIEQVPGGAARDS